jgi:hypothetical protein
MVMVIYNRGPRQEVLEQSVQPISRAVF